MFHILGIITLVITVLSYPGFVCSFRETFNTVPSVIGGFFLYAMMFGPFYAGAVSAFAFLMF